LNVISVNDLKPVTTRVTGARAHIIRMRSRLPTQRCPRGLPVGIQFVAPRFAARRLSACADWIWRELGSPDMVGYRD
jgi:Asp-tRNA(Asn)/Glu-tRNA(Gln) amidotransferase A subunit family amidase